MQWVYPSRRKPTFLANVIVRTMIRSGFTRVLALSLATAVLSIAAYDCCWAQSNDVAIGKSLYEAKCGACHSVDANRVGPMHRGIVGRLVASVPGYSYSSALKNLGGVWTPERLDLWLQNPQAVAAGSNMFFTVDDPVQRRQIIAYLSTLLSPASNAK